MRLRCDNPFETGYTTSRDILVIPLTWGHFTIACTGETERAAFDIGTGNTDLGRRSVICVRSNVTQCNESLQ